MKYKSIQQKFMDDYVAKLLSNETASEESNFMVPVSIKCNIDTTSEDFLETSQKFITFNLHRNSPFLIIVNLDITKHNMNIYVKLVQGSHIGGFKSQMYDLGEPEFTTSADFKWHLEKCISSTLNKYLLSTKANDVYLNHLVLSMLSEFLVETLGRNT